MIFLGMGQGLTQVYCVYKFRIICLVDRQCSHLLAYCPNTHNDWDWAEAQFRSQDLKSGLLYVWQGPSHWSHCWCLPVSSFTGGCSQEAQLVIKARQGELKRQSLNQGFNH